jgi:hypothetical protein
VTPTTTFIRKRKRPSGCGLWPTYLLGSDEHGTWLFTPQHSRHRDHEGLYCEVAQTSPGGPGEHALHLVPTDGWWFATWRPSGVLVADISTPPVLVDNEWTYVDLELDPYRRPDGSVGTQDWDELADAYRDGLIDDAEHAAAVAASRTLEHQFTNAVEPFGTQGWDRLDEAIALGLPALTDFGDRPVL